MAACVPRVPARRLLKASGEPFTDADRQQRSDGAWYLKISEMTMDTNDLMFNLNDLCETFGWEFQGGNPQFTSISC